MCSSRQAGSSPELSSSTATSWKIYRLCSNVPRPSAVLMFKCWTMDGVGGVVAVFLLCILFSATSLPLVSHEAAEYEDEKCSLCIDAVKLIQDALQSNRTLDDIFPLVEKICLDVMKDYSSAPYMCPGIIFSYGPVVQYVFTEKVLNPQFICEQVHLCDRHGDGVPVLSDAPSHSHRGSLPSSTVIGDINGRTSTPQFSSAQPRQGSQQITFVQISDIHLDHLYAEGSPVDCGLYVCCRKWYNGTGSAGHYGSRQCDLPKVTLDLLLDTLRGLDPQPDFYIYTGDNPPHDIWNETWISQLNATDYIVNYVASKLPNVTIYPAFGNHETWPESEYIGTLPKYKYLTEKLADYWQKWVSFPQEAITTIADGGYYSIKVMGNLRLISFNSNYGYGANIFTLLNDDNEHYSAQWKWIMSELASAKENGEKVLMIAHIPPGDSDNVADYGKFYLNMTKQFSDVIVGHFFGHTHRDQFQLIQDEDGVYGVAMVAPSVTPYPSVNPSFRVFTMDASSMMLTGYKQYNLNLSLANEMYSNGSGIQPRFKLSYSTVDEYGLRDLSPLSWADMVERFHHFPSLLDKYYYNIRGRSSLSDRVCDQECRRTVLCSVSNIISTNYFGCLNS